MAASQEELEDGFKCQHEVCDKFNQIFQERGSKLVATETDEKTDMTEKYDIKVACSITDTIKGRFDVKSTRQTTGNISYTTMDINGNTKPTNNAADNTLGIRLVFTMSQFADKMYIPDMEKWYELLSSLDERPGRTWVMELKNGEIVPKFGMRNKRWTNLRDYYSVTTTKEMQAGEEVTLYKGRAYIKHKLVDVDVLFDSKKQAWYFENGSKYVLVSSNQLQRICDPNNIFETTK